jgi:hypothetical protein
LQVRVEYGSDLDTDIYGSGFAMMQPTPSNTAGGRTAGNAAGASSGSDDEEGVPHAWDFGELVAWSGVLDVCS